MMKLVAAILILSGLPIFSFANHQSQVAAPSFSISTSVASYNVVDIMPSFWRFWEQSQKLDAGGKVRLFRELVIQPNKSLFEGFTGEAGDDRLTRYFDSVQPYIPAMRRLSNQLDTELVRYERSFRKKFPDRNWNGNIYFMPNLLGGWDAGSGNLEGRSVLVFGVDSIVKIHGENFNLATLFHHELFHVYHDQLHPEWRNKNRAKGEFPFYQLLWREGLATYVSKVLNPKASEAEVLLSKTLAKETAPLIAKLAKEMRENLDSTSTDTFMNFLSGSPKQPDIPGRSGYYIGMLIAKKLNKKYSLAELARLGGEQLRKEIEAALIKFES